MAVGRSSRTSSALASAGPLLLEEHVASNSATLDFTTFISSAYDEYEIRLSGIIPATDGASLYMRFSTDGGSTYDTSGVYSWSTQNAGVGGFEGVTYGGAGSAAQFLLFNVGLSSSANPAYVGSIRLVDPLGACQTLYRGLAIAKYSSNTSYYQADIAGFYASTTAVNAVRFLMSSGNIASGTIRVYGVSKSSGLTSIAGTQGGFAPLNSGLLIPTANMPSGLAGIPEPPRGSGDDEFDTTDTSDPMTGWTTLQTPTAHDINSTRKSHYYVKRTAVNSSAGHVGIYKTWSPSAGQYVETWIEDAVCNNVSFMVGAMLFIGEAAGSGKFQCGRILYDGTNICLRITAYNSVGTATTDLAGAKGGDRALIPPIGLRCVFTSSTSVAWYYSKSKTDKIWSPALLANNPGFTIGIAGVGVDTQQATTDAEALFDYVRFG